MALKWGGLTEHQCQNILRKLTVIPDHRDSHYGSAPHKPST